MTMLRATVRLQFHKDFTLDDAVPLVPYFARLGISHVYASPLLKSVEGSMHGYDTVDCHVIDPDRGGEAGLRRLVTALRGKGMGLLLDIVPNHMGVATSENRWWNDVLTHGEDSVYGHFFDIDWSRADGALKGKVLLPYLGEPLEQALAEGKLSFVYEHDRYWCAYADSRYPVRPESRLEIERGIKGFDWRTAAGRAWFRGILEQQHYRLIWWRAGNDLINWRRFFNVTSLAALRIEDDDVFEAAHEKVFDLYRQGLIDGVRADHVDGLTQPAVYCRKMLDRLEDLRKERSPELQDNPLVFVEKILGPGEVLPVSWPVDGTTGYDFLEKVSLVLHDSQGEELIDSFWKEMSAASFDDVQKRAREKMLDDSFRTELAGLVGLLVGVACRHAPGRDFTPDAIRQGMREICVCFPVYRSYFADDSNSSGSFDLAALDRACDGAKKRLPVWHHDLVDWIVLVLSKRVRDVDPEVQFRIDERFEHLTAPLAAKAGEDTAFYRYNRLISRNDVGGDPAIFASDVASFHRSNLERFERVPYALLTTATHDHKRGEDARARLAVLSEPCAEWAEVAGAWLRRDEGLFRDGVGRADAYFLYQVLIGFWPMGGGLPDRERLDGYLTKALREAALRTSWSAPDEAYEGTCRAFVAAVLDGGAGRVLASYIERIMAAGALNGLSQTVLRMTCPGVPDLYQGGEFWDLSLVDPDNRRPVDYEARLAGLERDETVDGAAGHWRDGHVKQALIASVLRFRAEYREVFARGAYRAIAVGGVLERHFIAFERVLGRESVLVVAPRLSLGLGVDDGLRVTMDGLVGTRLMDAPEGRWRRCLRSGGILERIPGDLGFLKGCVPIEVFYRVP